MFRDFLHLARPFWTSEERGKAKWTAGLLVVLTLASVGVSVMLVQLGGAIFDAVQNYNLKAFLHALEFWSLWAFLFCAIYVYQSYVSMALNIRWRRWMTDHFLRQWLDNKAFYFWQIGGQPSDNPDQRISEDIRDFIGTNDGLSGAIPLALGLLQQVATLLAFVTLLWKVGGALPLMHGQMLIHGYLVWCALLYAGLGSSLMARLGFPVIRLNFNQQRYEADFRFSLVRLRENGESVALSNGETAEQANLMGRFGSIIENYRRIMSRTKKINGFSIGYQQVANIIPYFLCAPVYFSHHMTLGGLNQSAQSFAQVQGAVSFFITAYSAIALWRSTIQRLSGFTQAVEAAHALSQQSTATRHADRNGTLALNGMTLALPDGRTLFRDLDLSLEAGQSALISGPSGSGKSTLLRAIFGLWPYASGDMRLPADFDPMVLPQKPYLPIGSLRAALAYPAAPDRFSDTGIQNAPDRFSDTGIQNALARVRLPQIAGRLDESQNWALQLSPGEQQRVALARAFLHQPRWLFLDEATSALDEPAETALYQELAAALPRTTLVSIGHRSTLHALHDVSHRLTPAVEPVTA
jgi:putative ATP-binding cassette transporter